MLLLSFALAVTAAALSWQEGGWLFFVPAFVAFSALWDLVLRWRFNNRINALMNASLAGHEEDEVKRAAFFAKALPRARWRLFATPVYFLVALGSLIAALIV